MVPKPFDLTALRKVLALVHMLPPYDFNLPGECFVAVLEEPLEGVGAVTTPADAAKRWAHLAAANHGLPQYIEFCTLFRRLRTDGNLVSGAPVRCRAVNVVILDVAGHR